MCFDLVDLWMRKHSRWLEKFSQIIDTYFNHENISGSPGYTASTFILISTKRMHKKCRTSVLSSIKTNCFCEDQVFFKDIYRTEKLWSLFRPCLYPDICFCLSFHYLLTWRQSISCTSVLFQHSNCCVLDSSPVIFNECPSLLLRVLKKKNKNKKKTTKKPPLL